MTSLLNLPFGHGMRSPVQLTRYAKQKAHPTGWAFVLELLARFELATRSKEAKLPWSLMTSLLNLPFGHGMRSPVQLIRYAKQKAHPTGWAFVLELLARFELATSSLPTILGQFLPCASCRKLLDKTLVYQRLFGFACCPLL